jgi:hypothetical protein
MPKKVTFFQRENGAFREKDKSFSKKLDFRKYFLWRKIRQKNAIAFFCSTKAIAD